MRIAAAMSGGVDSSVAAYELKKRGDTVVGLTIKTWPKEECGAMGEKLCCSLESIQYARSVAGDLGIPYFVIDLSKEFTEEVKKYFEEEYRMGRTPNPCVYCNSRIKFGYLLKKARELGSEKIATGHFARILEKGGKYYLAEGKDKNKDQSYFLYDIPREVLASIEFPLGEYTKDKVREIAMEQNLMTAGRPSSQDICFTTKDGDYRKYLENKGIEAFEPGDIVDTDGNVLGRHKGIAGYTVGQRKGLEVSSPNPLYVIKIDPKTNTVVAAEREKAMSSKIKVAGFNWLSIDVLDEAKDLEVKIRYNSPKVNCTITPSGDDEAVVEFSQPQFAPAPGQAAVFYEGEIVVGGGWIEEIIN